MKTCLDSLAVKGRRERESSQKLLRRLERGGIQNIGSRYAWGRKRFIFTVVIEQKKQERRSEADTFITVIRGR